MNVLSHEYQEQFKNRQFIDNSIPIMLKRAGIKGHNGLYNPLSSQACCINFFFPFIEEKQKESNNTEDLLRKINHQEDDISSLKQQLNQYKIQQNMNDIKNYKCK
mgnify:CR=1 FL=1